MRLVQYITFHRDVSQAYFYAMADPLSVLGAAVGVTSLIMQTTDECIKGCNASDKRILY